eukprot:c23726_g1_i3 orf=508-3402(+)
MAQCHAERRKHPSAMDFYVGALHSKLYSSNRAADKYPHWPSYNNAASVNTSYTRSSQSFREEPTPDSRPSLFGGSFRESTLSVNPSLELKSSGNLSYTAPEKASQKKFADEKPLQSTNLSRGGNNGLLHDGNSTTAKSLTYHSNGVAMDKETKASSIQVSNVMNMKVEKDDSSVCSSGVTSYQPKLIGKEIKLSNADSALLSSNSSITSASTGAQGSRKYPGDLNGKNGSAIKQNCNDQGNNFPRIYKSAELGVAFSSKGGSKAGTSDVASRLYKSGEQVAPKCMPNAGNLKESLNGGLIVGSQKVAGFGSGDSSSIIGGSPTANKEGGRWSSTGSNGSADSSYPIGGSPTSKDGGRKASFSNSGSSDEGSPMAKDVLKRSTSCGYGSGDSSRPGDGSPTPKDCGRVLSTGSVLNSKDVSTPASVRGMGNILGGGNNHGFGKSKISSSKAGCNDIKVGDCPSRKAEDSGHMNNSANGRGLLTSNVSVDGASNRNMGNLCPGNWNSSVSNGNILSHGMVGKTYSKPVEETRNGCEPMDPEDIKNAGNEQYKMGHFSEAVALYDKSIAMCPNHAPYRSNRAAALAGLGRLGEAVLECEEAIKLDPQYSRAHQRAGHLYLRLGLIESAKRHLRVAVLQDDTKDAQALQTVERHISRCIEARRVGDWRSVLRESSAAVVAGADSAAQVLGYKSEALLKLHRLEEAEAVCAEAQRHESSLHKLGVAPADSFLHMLRAHIEMYLGRFEGAVSAAEVAAKIDPRNPDAVGLVKRARAVCQTRTSGNELFKAGRLFEACAVYGEGLESDPTNAVLLCNRAACRSKLGQWEKAIEDCDAALIAQPNYIKALMRRAHCSTKLERWEDALRDYEVLRVEMPNDIEVARGYFDAQVAIKKSRGEEIHRMKFGGEVEEVLNEDQFREVVTFPGLSVVQFITRWSDRCCQISPFIDQLCKRFPCVHFVKVAVWPAYAQ